MAVRQTDGRRCLQSTCAPYVLAGCCHRQQKTV